MASERIGFACQQIWGLDQGDAKVERGSPDGRQAADTKRRRVAAFMKHLPESWSKLEEGFRNKYSVKVRREAQRLLLLEREIAIPPTRLLDTCWSSFSESPYEVYECLSQCARDRQSFVREFLVHVNANFPSLKHSSRTKV